MGVMAASGDEDFASLQSWWSEVRNLGLEDIAAGKVLKLWNSSCRVVRALRGQDARLFNLYVRSCFDPLYREILRERIVAGRENWICHLNGNSGVGKSAFLWYFIIRIGIEYRMWGWKLHILYESANYIWEFKDDVVHVGRRYRFTGDTFSRVSWHLINQEVRPDGAMGLAVLLAASPEKANVKALKADRKKTVFYMYPWEEREYEALVLLWKAHYENLATEMATAKEKLQRLEEWATGSLSVDTHMVAHQAAVSDVAKLPKVLAQVDAQLQQAFESRSVEHLALRLSALIKALEAQVHDGLERVKAAPGYYQWFGGVVRLLWSEHIKTLKPYGFSAAVNESLKKTNLLQFERGFFQ